ncbi:MAG: Tex family protein [Clostridia bacterium]|nr:Tex family protein [Clostridia bacterium]MDY5263657.1 Tex family protein [Eubacteriales bacterium]
MNIELTLSREFDVKPEYTKNIIALIDEGNTIPFIARYRKEKTGEANDQMLREFYDRLIYLRNLETRKQEVADNITEQGKMTDEIAMALVEAKTLTEVEDIYRPFKQKKKTRASVAVERGLEPLAKIIYGQNGENIEEIAKGYVNEEKGVNTVEEAINGAKDIIAEWISDNANYRKALRQMVFDKGNIETAFTKEKNSDVYDMYGEYSEAINKIPSHRILAINRGEKEKCLKVSVVLDKELALDYIKSHELKTDSKYMIEAIEDSYVRLIFPSIEREVRNELTDVANEQAIKMFEVNLKPLLMQAPLKNKVILGLDPAYRTGCKIAVIDKNGNVLATTVIYPTPPQNKIEESKAIIKKLIKKFNVEVISIGNGTASKESEIFVSDLIKELDTPVGYMVVNESGASVYSASKLGAEEFPDFDVSLRSAVSIARRLQDPLAELIKIDVKSIGVGQYQHDMPEKRLDEVLGGVVEDCVNSVGVDLNTASVSLLKSVAGLNNAIAKNIVTYRETTPFTSRKQLLDVPKLGPKAYTQCAGFLRIPNSKNVLDNTGVHPESYKAVRTLMEHFGYTAKDVKDEKLQDLKERIDKEGRENIAKMCDIGTPTLMDVVEELLKPGRDIRDELPQLELRKDLMDISNLKEGMVLKGTVRNVIDFGVFVDIAVHQDGLVHISQITDVGYVKHPSDVLKVGDIVEVKVLGVDVERKRISLTMIGCKNDFMKERLAKTNVTKKGRTDVKNRAPKEKSVDDMLKALQNKFGGTR